jgi:hypothetical protein
MWGRKFPSSPMTTDGLDGLCLKGFLVGLFHGRFLVVPRIWAITYHFAFTFVFLCFYTKILNKLLNWGLSFCGEGRLTFPWCFDATDFGFGFYPPPFLIGGRVTFGQLTLTDFAFLRAYTFLCVWFTGVRWSVSHSLTWLLVPRHTNVINKKKFLSIAKPQTDDRWIYLDFHVYS